MTSCEALLVALDFALAIALAAACIIQLAFVFAVRLVGQAVCESTPASASDENNGGS